MSVSLFVGMAVIVMSTLITGTKTEYNQFFPHVGAGSELV
jgi:hypothetical protein